MSVLVTLDARFRGHDGFVRSRFSLVALYVA
jgi:hypothetical protein